MDFKAQFSLPKNFTYLNTGTMSYTPKSVLSAIEVEKGILEENPAHGLLSAWRRLWDIQKELASFINARPQDIFLRTNVTYAMNDFLMAVDLPKGSEILISNLEYGAIVNICRLKAELEGHQIKMLELRLRGAPLTEAEILEKFEKAIGPKTKLAMFSHVATACSLLFPIEKMAAICRRHGVIFAVDGAHGAGSVPLDFRNSQLDFYGSNLHKWMMGPKGTGFGWVSPHLRDRLKPKFAGWTTYDLAPHFAEFAEGDAWSCRWMISSTHNFSDFYGIKAILDFWKQMDPEKIYGRQRKLRDYTLKKISAETGWHSLSDFSSDLAGPMLAFTLPPKLAKLGYNLMFTLKDEHRLQTSMTQIQGEWCLRLAPHIYNDEADIDRAAAVLQSIN